MGIDNQRRNKEGDRKVKKKKEASKECECIPHTDEEYPEIIEHLLSFNYKKHLRGIKDE